LHDITATGKVIQKSKFPQIPTEPNLHQQHPKFSDLINYIWTNKFESKLEMSFYFDLTVPLNKIIFVGEATFIKSHLIPSGEPNTCT
jgi:hypothetical protein